MAKGIRRQAYFGVELPSQLHLHGIPPRCLHLAIACSASWHAVARPAQIAIRLAFAELVVPHVRAPHCEMFDLESHFPDLENAIRFDGRVAAGCLERACKILHTAERAFGRADALRAGAASIAEEGAFLRSTWRDFKYCQCTASPQSVQFQPYLDTSCMNEHRCKALSASLLAHSKLAQARLHHHSASTCAYHGSNPYC